MKDIKVLFTGCHQSVSGFELYIEPSLKTRKVEFVRNFDYDITDLNSTFDLAIIARCQEVELTGEEQLQVFQADGNRIINLPRLSWCGGASGPTYIEWERIVSHTLLTMSA